MDGKMLICLEDLAHYGFSVHYDDSARSLFVNKIGQAEADYVAEISEDKGNIIGYTYETDIKAYLNGALILAECIGGRLAVADLDNLRDDCVSGILSIKNDPQYFIMQSYNDWSRRLHVFTDIGIYNLYESYIKAFEADIAAKNVVTEIVQKYSCDDYTEYVYRGADRRVYANDESLTAIRFYKNGRIVDYSNVLIAYDFIGWYGGGTSLYDSQSKPCFSEDGRYLIFKAERTKETMSLMGTRDSYDSGEYRLDLDTCKLEKLM